MAERPEQPDLPPTAWLPRRDFLVRTGLLLGTATLAACGSHELPDAARSPTSTSTHPSQAASGAQASPPAPPAPTRSSTQPAPLHPDLLPTAVHSWESVRHQFQLAPDLIHMSGFFLASHPKPVRDAIDAHRRGLDANPIEYYVANAGRYEAAVLRAAAAYLGGQATDIALTDSTTMGLGLLYGGLKLRAGQEMLTTTHDHYATTASLQLRAARTGAALRAIPLYQQPATTSSAEIVERLVQAVRPQTRIVALTWVHSSTGLKLPIREIARALAEVNAARAEEERALLCVDGVHGFGVEAVGMAELGCDFFIAGCHKWLCGPRGTGLVWGKPAAWPVASATIPTFDGAAYARWMAGLPPADLPFGAAMTPGGFHSFEHRWALAQAFQFHEAIGKARIAGRIHALNQQLKAGLAQMRHVTVHTPQADELSAGLVCFEVAGLSAAAVVTRLRERKIMASVTPYATRYARLAPGLLTLPEDVEQTLRAVRGLANA